MKGKTLLCLCFIIFFSVSALAQKKPEQFVVKVKISVEHDSDTIKKQMYDAIAKEAQILNNEETDVQILPNGTVGEDYTIEVTMVDIIVNNKRIGLAVAVNITEKAKCDFKWNKTNNKQNKPIDCNVLLSTYVATNYLEFENNAKSIIKQLQRTYEMKRSLVVS